MATHKKVVNLTDDQNEILKAAAEKIGLKVPAYLRAKALEAANKGESNG